MAEGKMWTQCDRFGNDIYLTHERWQHIIDPDNHPDWTLDKSGEPFRNRVFQPQFEH